MYCFTGRKQKVAKGCYYSISLDSDERKRSKGQSEESQFIGKVRSDRKAVEYWLYDDGANPEKKEEHGPLRREMLFVSFVNSLRNRNPGAMEVVVPGVDAAGDAVPIRPSAGKDGIQELLKKNDLTSIVPLKNREPKWNPQSNMYQLDFQGRATMASRTACVSGRSRRTVAATWSCTASLASTSPASWWRASCLATLPSARCSRPLRSCGRRASTRPICSSPPGPQATRSRSPSPSTSISARSA